MAIKGMLIKKESRSSIILTPDGEFRRVPASFPNSRPGSEVTFKPGWTRYLRTGGLAAALVVLFLTWQLFQAFVPQAAAYVSLDFGPSLELALNKKGEIMKVFPLNPEGEALLAGLDLPGRDLEQGLTLILQRGLQPESPQPLLCTFITVKTKKIPPDFQDQVMGTLNQVLGVRSQPGAYQIRTIPSQVRAEAQKKGISTGRYILHLEAQKQGKTIPLSELKKEKWSTLTNKHQDIFNHLLPVSPSLQPGAQVLQPPQKTGEGVSASPEKKPELPKGKLPVLENLEDGAGTKAYLKKILTAPEEQIEEQSQEEAQKQTGNEGKIKGKISPLHKEIPGQPAQGRDFAQ